MGIPVATLSDRTNRPLVIGAGVAIWSLATAACGLASSFAGLFASRLLVGAGESTLSPATHSLIADLFPREKLGRATAIFSVGSFLGSGIAFLVGGTIISAVNVAEGVTILGVALRPWQFVFIVVGAPGLLLAPLLWLTVKEPRAPEARRHADVPSFPAVLRMLWCRRAVFVPHMVGFTFAAMALFAVLGWSPAYLMRTFAMDAGQSGLWLGLIAIVAGGGGVLTSGLLMDHLTVKGRRDAPFVTGVIGALGTILPVALLPQASTPPAGLAILTLAMFFASFPMAPSTAVMQVASPPLMRSRVSAIFLCSNSLIGLTLGSVLVGLLNDIYFRDPKDIGVSIALVGSGAAAFAALVLARGRRPFARL
jgi:MFS family permease